MPHKYPHCPRCDYVVSMITRTKTTATEDEVLTIYLYWCSMCGLRFVGDGE